MTLLGNGTSSNKRPSASMSASTSTSTSAVGDAGVSLNIRAGAPGDGGGVCPSSSRGGVKGKRLHAVFSCRCVARPLGGRRCGDDLALCSTLKCRARLGSVFAVSGVLFGAADWRGRSLEGECPCNEGDCHVLKNIYVRMVYSESGFVS